MADLLGDFFGLGAAAQVPPDVFAANPNGLVIKTSLATSFPGHLFHSSAPAPL
jgi:hypothetical protein